MRKYCVGLALIAPTAALAGQSVVGSSLFITYEDAGTWCDTDAEAGFQALLGGDWVEFVYPGSPWQHTTFEYDVLGTPYDYDGNTDYDLWTWTTTSESDISTSQWAISEYRWTAGTLEIVKTEKWAKDGMAVLIRYDVTNAGADPVDNFRSMTAFDPDQDYALDENYSTLNDTVDRDGDGTNDWAVSVGPTSGYAIGIAPCDPTTATLGHSSEWYDDPDDTSLFTDDEDAEGDNAMHWVHTQGTLAAGETVTFAMIVAVGETEAAAETALDDGWYVCPNVCQDADADGYYDADCGGDDCDDAEATAFPGGTEVWYDGIDGDCSGGSDDDQDGDGYAWDGAGGDDCDDENAAVNPGGTETLNDVDDDCSGVVDDVDADGDGYTTVDDCDDADGNVHPGAADAPYDGVDGDCSGGSDNDADGDGSDSADHGGDDCNDADADVFPGNDETWYDGVDGDCSGGSDDDQDGDGDDSAEHGGTDCDDTDASVVGPCAIDDTDDGGDDTAKGGCNCDVAPGANPAGFAGLLGLVGLVLRRRR